jgi:hypothetical protein
MGHDVKIIVADVGMMMRFWNRDPVLFLWNLCTFALDPGRENYIYIDIPCKIDTTTCIIGISVLFFYSCDFL